MHRLLHFLMRTLRLQLCLLLGLGFGVPEGRALSLYTNHPTVAEALTSAAEEISELAKDPLRLAPRVAVVDLVERLHRDGQGRFRSGSTDRAAKDGLADSNCYAESVLELPCLSFPNQIESGDPEFGVTEFGARSGDLLVLDGLPASGCCFS